MRNPRKITTDAGFVRIAVLTQSWLCVCDRRVRNDKYFLAKQIINARTAWGLQSGTNWKTGTWVGDRLLHLLHFSIWKQLILFTVSEFCWFIEDYWYRKYTNVIFFHLKSRFERQWFSPELDCIIFHSDLRVLYYISSIIIRALSNEHLIHRGWKYVSPHQNLNKDYGLWDMGLHLQLDFYGGN